MNPFVNASRIVDAEPCIIKDLIDALFLQSELPAGLNTAKKNDNNKAPGTDRIYAFKNTLVIYITNMHKF